jgi:hypothetical protein
VVIIFIAATGGLLVWAAVKPWVDKWIEVPHLPLVALSFSIRDERRHSSEINTDLGEANEDTDHTEAKHIRSHLDNFGRVNALKMAGGSSFHSSKDFRSRFLH